MTNHAGVFQPAIDALEADLDDMERQANALRASINLLRSKAGLPPRPEGGGPGSPSKGDNQSTSVSIKSDQFFGRRQQTAIKEYLEMRKAAGDGPASTREIYDALKSGGFTFEAKDDDTAMIGLRATLRKRSETFVKVGGNHALASWYPNSPKKPKTPPSKGDQPPGDNGSQKPGADDDPDDVEIGTEVVKKTA